MRECSDFHTRNSLALDASVELGKITDITRRDLVIADFEPEIVLWTTAEYWADDYAVREMPLDSLGGKPTRIAVKIALRRMVIALTSITERNSRSTIR